MTEERFETEKYLFWFYELKRAVGIGIVPIERNRKITDEDVNEIKEVFGSMGKWEVVVETGKSLLKDLGIIKKSENDAKREFGFEKYDIKYNIKEEEIKVEIRLKPDESLRRTRRDSNRAIPFIEEILEQIKNIPKWQKLEKTLSELKDLSRLIK